MPDLAPEPAPVDAVVVTVRWRVRDELGVPVGSWHAVAITTMPEAIAFQTIWLADLDVEVRVGDGPG